MSGGAVNYGKCNIEGLVSAEPRPSEGRCGPRSRPEAHWPGRAGVIGNVSNCASFPHFFADSA